MYNFFNEVPYTHEIKINGKKYSICHYNSFDNTNIIGFILINVPPDENTDKIKKQCNQNIISSQIWFTACKKKNIINYQTTQILNIDEAKPKIYYSYDLKSNKYSIFDNFYFKMFNYLEQWNSSKSEALKYFENLENIYEKMDKNEFYLIKNNYNINFNPDSADFYTFKKFTNLLLFVSLKGIKDNNINNLEKIYDSWNDFLENYINLIEKLNKLGKLLSYHQKIRIIDSYTHDVLIDNEKYGYSTKFLYINEKHLKKNNAYLLAFKFNIDVINNLKETSALTKCFKQLDSYIMKNYFIIDNDVRNEKAFALINEPIQLMKYHLLINYENFILINNKDIYKNKIIKALQDNSNRVTFINEKILFNNFYSEKLKEENNAFPISMEFFHENSHSKKNSKNFNKSTPLTCFIDNKIILLDEREDGKFIESIIGNNEFITDLKNPNNKLGELMKIEYFTEENFDKLHQKYEELNKLKNRDNKEINYKKLTESDPSDIDIKIKKKKNIKNVNELKTVNDFENYYLINNQFIYPDSLPYHHYPLGKKFEITEGEKRYLDKYKDQISNVDNDNSNDKKNIDY